LSRRINGRCGTAAFNLRFVYMICGSTYGTHAVEAGIDVCSVAKLMGHADLRTTERYVHLSKAHLEDAQKKIERFCEFGSLVSRAICRRRMCRSRHAVIR
jgi:Phage integrase family